MKQVQCPVTFEIRIEEYKNNTWQGKLMTEDGQVAPFRSEMELLLTIDQLLCRDKETTCWWNASE